LRLLKGTLNSDFLIVNTLLHCKGVGLVQGLRLGTLDSDFLIVNTPGH
jgi:hypothetical protein